MKRRSILVAVAAVILAVIGTAVGVAVVVDDDPRPWRGAAGMAHGSGAVAEPDYLAEMVAHHQEAVEAAGELARSDRAEMQAFGESIIETQSAQIRQMQTWLADWYPDRSSSVDYQPMMRDLAALSGDDLDLAFLEDMIGHHMAAVMMSQHLLLRGTEHQEVATLARSIRDDQHAEIAQMHRWLRQWFDADVRRGTSGHMGRGHGMWSSPSHD